MATVRHLGLFPQVLIGPPGNPFLPQVFVGTCEFAYESISSNVQAQFVELNLVDALACYWRVKDWQITNTSVSVASITRRVVDLQTEKQLVCGRKLPSYQWTFFGSIFISMGPTSEFSTLIQNGDVIIRGQPDKYFFKISGQDSSTNGINTPDDVIRPVHVGNLQFNFLHSGTINGAPFTFTATVSPSEYWPYDPNDGLGPIYDSTTGEQLRPFPA
jgi:hypothetical protein